MKNSNSFPKFSKKNVLKTGKNTSKLGFDIGYF